MHVSPGQECPRCGQSLRTTAKLPDKTIVDLGLHGQRLSEDRHEVRRALCLAFQEGGDAGTAAARLPLRESWRWLSETIDRGLELSSPTQREQTLDGLGGPVGALLEGASLVDATDLRDAAVGVLCRDVELVGCAIATLRATPTSQWSPAGLDAVATHCAAVLEARLARPSRAGDDWSIELRDGCSCELCAELRRFLGDPTQTRFEWPLAKERTVEPTCIAASTPPSSR